MDTVYGWMATDMDITWVVSTDEWMVTINKRLNIDII